MTTETLLTLTLCGMTVGLAARVRLLTRRLRDAERDAAWWREQMTQSDWAKRYYSERLAREIDLSCSLAELVMDPSPGETHDN